MMPYFLKVVQALQYTGEVDHTEFLVESWCEGFLHKWADEEHPYYHDGDTYHDLNVGDWIVKTKTSFRVYSDEEFREVFREL